MNLIKVIISAHLLGLFTFNLFGVLNLPWTTAYFFWDKSVGGGFLVWLLIYKLTHKADRWMIRPVLVISIFRFIWQAVSYIVGWNINNQWWLALFFILLSGGAMWLLYNEQTRINKWLTKNLNV